MSASSSSPMVHTTRIALVVLVLSLACGVVAGCTVPGKERLAGTPEDMPASLNYLSGDALGWLIVDTDANRAQSKQLARTFGMDDADLAAPILERLHLGDGRGWIGATAGVEQYTSRSDEPSQLTFVDVDDRDALEGVLRDNGYVRTETNLDAGNDRTLRLWTRGESKSNAGDIGAIGVADDALVGADTRTSLAKLIAHTRRYAASERPGMVDYTIDALKATPLTVVFRSDQVRGDLRTLVGGSPALTEMTRWLTQASAIYALRDGWIGAVPGAAKNADDHVRVIGRMDWARAATEVPEPKSVPKPEPAELAGSDWAVAMTNPGSYVADVVDAISDGGNEFVTGKDAPKDTPKLGKLLEELDGPALVTGRGRDVVVDVDVTDPSATERRARKAIELADVDDLVDVNPTGNGSIAFTASLDGRPRASAQRTNPEGRSETITAAMAAAGRPPSQPVAWVYLAKSPCDPTRPAAGWVTWHSPSQRLAWSFDVPVSTTTATADATRCSKLLGSAG